MNLNEKIEEHVAKAILNARLQWVNGRNVPAKIVTMTAEAIRKEVLMHAKVQLLPLNKAKSKIRTLSVKKNTGEEILKAVGVTKKQLKTVDEVITKIFPKTKPEKTKPENTKIWSQKGNPLSLKVTFPSDDLLKRRIQQIVDGVRNNEGISIGSLFQRLSNHRDLIGTGAVTIPKLMRLVNELNKNKFLFKSGAGRGAVLYQKTL